MFLELLLAIILGICAGVITGLIPGIHVNLVATLALAIGIGPSGAPFLVALAVTHSFLDVIPSILLGAPDSAMALGVLPGHRYLLKGWGYMAVKLTLVGSFFGLLIAITAIPFWWFAIKLYPVIQPVMGYILLAVSLYMILKDRKKLWSLTIYALSGALGFILLRFPVTEEPLFPLFSGLFGISTLLYSLSQNTAIPKQDIEKRIKLRKKDAITALAAGNISGFLTSMLPGLGAAQGAVLGMQLARNVGDHGFLILLGAINTVNFTLSLLTWLALDKARNGAVVAIQQLTQPSMQIVALLLITALIAGSLSVGLCLYLTRKAIRIITKVPYSKLCLAVIAVIIILVTIITGWRGLLVLTVATAVGLIPAIVKCSRAHAMGCLMLPVALYFL